MNEILIVFLLVVFAALAIAKHASSQHQKTLRQMREVRSYRVADAPDGALVRIAGTVHAGPELLEAPFSGRRCACYRVRIEHRPGERDWWELIREDESVDFVVEDASGRAIVRANHLHAAITLDRHERSGTFDDATPEQAAYLARYDEATTNELGLNRALAYREAVLEPGEHVVVVGEARWEDGPEPADAGDYRQSARQKRLVIVAPKTAPVRVSDDPDA